MPTLLNQTNVHYVKFIRGSIQAWDALNLTPEKIDNDTLYFIYASASNTREGKLYLGQKLISSANNALSINDIVDINIDGTTLANKQILVYNDTTQAWENASLAEIIDTAIGTMTGATAAADGAEGLVPRPLAGDENKFLRGDGSWVMIDIPTFDTEVFSLESNEVNLNGFDEAPVGSVLIKTANGIEWSTEAVGKLDRQITTLEKLQAQLNGTDPDPISTNTIYMVLNGNDSESSNRYDEYMVIGNSLELLGKFGEVDLQNYVTVPTFNTAIGLLEDTLYDHTNSQTGETIPGLVSRVAVIENNYITQAQIGNLNNLNLSDGSSNLVDQVNSLTEKLTWKDLLNE